MSAAYEYRIDLPALERDERRVVAAAARLRRAARELERVAVAAEKARAAIAKGGRR